MSTKIIKKILLLIGLLLMIYTCNSNYYISYASENGELWESTINTLQATNEQTEATDKVKSVVSTIAAAVKIAGVTTAIVILLVIAMKYMTAAPGDKADVKKSLIPYLVGAIIVFGAMGIIELIESLAQAFN